MLVLVLVAKFVQRLGKFVYSAQKYREQNLKTIPGKTGSAENEKVRWKIGGK